jgi:hypothetical protein
MATSTMPKPSDAYVIVKQTILIGAVSANTDKADTEDVSKNGYSLIGIVGYNLEGMYCSRYYVYQLHPTSTTALRYAIRGTEASTGNGLTMTVWCMYMKN